MKDRFDLEQEINALYGFSEQLSTISQAVLEERLSTDETVNAIEGIRVLMDLQAQKLHDTMCQILKLDNYKEYV